MQKLIYQLQKNGLIQDDDGPWGALIVLAAKHGQDDAPLHDYIWHLCVSYRQLNQASRPFKLPIPPVTTQSCTSVQEQNISSHLISTATTGR
jgi:hypothetical protein